MAVLGSAHPRVEDFRLVSGLPGALLGHGVRAGCLSVNIMLLVFGAPAPWTISARLEIRVRGSMVIGHEPDHKPQN